MGEPVRLTEVFPRDGIQSLRGIGLRAPPAEEKIELIGLIRHAGVPEVEITSFAHPRVVPELADADQVAAAFGEEKAGVYRALVPNLVGAERAFEAGMRSVSCAIVVSETYQRKNANMSVADNLREIERVLEAAVAYGADVSVGVGMCFLCPYEGWIPEGQAVSLVEQIAALGVRRITVSDSVGLAHPCHVQNLVETILGRWPDLDFALHLHDAWGGALASCAAAYAVGVRAFESSLCGIGSGIAMPDDVRAGGNISTEALVYLLEGLGADTGINLALLRTAADAAAEALGLDADGITLASNRSFFAGRSRPAVASAGLRLLGATLA